MRGLFVVVCLLASILPAFGADEFAASFRLRGGYDSNPLLAPRGRGSPLIGIEGAFAYGRDTGEWIAGVTAEASLTRYQQQEFEPLQNYRLRLRFANKEQNDISLDATTTLVRLSTYDTHSEFANQRVHLQWVGGAFRPFVAGDLRYAALNELNVLLGEFMPEPMRYLRGTITPGIAYVKEKHEIGASIAFSRTRYEDEFDLFGFRRRNDRMQPSLYAKYTGEKFALSGAVSYLRVHSEEEYFTDVKAFLFDFSLATKVDAWSGDVSFSRTGEDTTFPISPLTINTVFQTKIAREIDDRTSAAVFGRVLQRKYWDTPFTSRTRIVGVEVFRDFADDIRVGGEIGFAKSLLISGAESGGVIATLALTKRFGKNGK